MSNQESDPPEGRKTRSGCRRACSESRLGPRHTPARMDEEAMWKNFYQKIVEEKEAKENEQQEKSEHEIR